MVPTTMPATDTHSEVLASLHAVTLSDTDGEVDRFWAITRQVKYTHPNIQTYQSIKSIFRVA